MIALFRAKIGITSGNGRKIWQIHPAVIFFSTKNLKNIAQSNRCTILHIQILTICQLLQQVQSGRYIYYHFNAPLEPIKNLRNICEKNLRNICVKKYYLRKKTTLTVNKSIK